MYEPENADTELQALLLCTRKTPHKTHSDAQASLLSIRKRDKLKRRSTITKLNVYRCSSCGYWHIGTTRVNYQGFRRPIR